MYYIELTSFHSLIDSFDTYLLRTYYVSDPEDTHSPALMALNTSSHHISLRKDV